MSQLYILIGLPGSGKTHWAKNMVKNDNLTVIVSRDSFRSMIKGEGEYIFDNLYESSIKKATDFTIREFVQSGFDVIVDETHFLKKRRIETMNIVSGLDCQIVYVWFTDMDTLNNRMLNDRGYSKEKWEEVINKMKIKFEEPSVEEGCNVLLIQKPWRSSCIVSENIQ